MIANAILADTLITQLPLTDSVFLDIGAHLGSVFSAVHSNDPMVTIFAVEAEAAKA